MTNKFVSRMKDTVNKFYEAMKTARAEIDKNNERYLPNIAAEENEKIAQELSAKERAAEAEIDAIAQEALADVERWKALSGKEIDDADLKLLQGAFKLTEADIKDLVEKHKANGTMIRAIGDYAEAHKIAAVIPTPEAKIKAYSIIAGDAKNMIGEIEDTLLRNQPSASGFSIDTIAQGFLNEDTLVYGQTLSVLF